jgi:hypothetical protein
VTDLSGDEMVALFRRQLKVLREGRDAVSAHITASQETIKQSRALLVQLDEQINRMERELGWVGGLPQLGSPS